MIIQPATEDDIIFSESESMYISIDLDYFDNAIDEQYQLSTLNSCKKMRVYSFFGDMEIMCLEGNEYILQDFINNTMGINNEFYIELKTQENFRVNEKNNLVYKQ